MQNLAAIKYFIFQQVERKQIISENYYTRLIIIKVTISKWTNDQN